MNALDKMFVAILSDSATTFLLTSTFVHVAVQYLLVQCLSIAPCLRSNPLVMTAGVFVPTQKQDRRRLTWWINWLNFWGAVMYCIG